MKEVAPVFGGSSSIGFNTPTSSDGAALVGPVSSLSSLDFKVG